MALMKTAVIPEFFARLKQAIPEPETELEYENVYHLLVAVVLSAQATDVGVNRATEPLFKLVKTPAQMLELGEKKLIGYIKTIGLFRTKARNVMGLSKILVEKHRLDFYRCLTEKLLTYALGRGLEYYDEYTVDRIVEQLDTHDGRFSVLINGIVESAPFQRRRADPTVASSADGAATADTAADR